MFLEQLSINFFIKKKINILTTLFISHKNDIKAFLK